MTFEQLCEKLELTPEDVAMYGGDAPATVEAPEPVNTRKAEPVEERFARAMGISGADFQTMQKDGLRLGTLRFAE